MEITAEIISTSQISDVMQSVQMNVYKDGVFQHLKELDVRATNFEGDIRAYLASFKEAEEAREALLPGITITL